MNEITIAIDTTPFQEGEKFCFSDRRSLARKLLDFILRRRIQYFKIVRIINDEKMIIRAI